jgi:predicted RNase H-like nuclease
MRYVGIDGCRGGLFAVTMGDDGSWKTGMFDSLDDVMSSFPGARHVLVDIPIGLPSHAPRACDREARRLLGPKRASSVFPVPCRKAVYARTYERACSLNQRAMGVKVSRQAWGLCPGIAGADRLLQSSRHLVGMVRESHPELCLGALLGGRPLRFPKKTAQGRLERMSILETVFDDAVRVYEQSLAGYARSAVARDDIIDALALAVASWSCRGQLRSIPDDPEFDETGLPMEIVLP